jgi:hypothetical protein
MPCGGGVFCNWWPLTKANFVMDKKIKSFEELEIDGERLDQSILDHQREVEARREIDLGHIRKVLKFYKVRLEEISEHLHTEKQGQGDSGSDYWSKRK